VVLCLLVSSAALTLHILSPAVLSQAYPFDQPNVEPDWLVFKPPDDGGLKRRLNDADNSKTFVSERRSHNPMVLIPPIPKPVSPRAYVHCSRNVERWWRARCKPLSVAVAAKRRISSVVGINTNLSVKMHLPSTEAASARYLICTLAVDVSPAPLEF